MMNGFLTIFGPLLVQVLKTNKDFTWNAKLMKQSVVTAIAHFEEQFGSGDPDSPRAVFFFDHSFVVLAVRVMCISGPFIWPRPRTHCASTVWA
jgi:hypothetical protein